MKAYKYNKDTLIYEGEVRVFLDPIATEKEGKEVYAKPMYTTFIEPPKCRKGYVPVYNVADDTWGTTKSYIGSYVINTKSNVATKLEADRPLRNYEVIVSEENFKDIKNNPDKYKITEGKIIDISSTQEYKNKVNISKYYDLIRAEKEKYDNFLNTPIMFNGSTYLPRYIDDYAKLQLRSFPQEIWDSTGLSSKVMGKDIFMKLKEYLENAVNKAYKAKKEAIKKYMMAIKKLEG